MKKLMEDQQSVVVPAESAHQSIVSVGSEKPECVHCGKRHGRDVFQTRSGRCLKCGSEDHQIRECPNLKKKFVPRDVPEAMKPAVRTQAPARVYALTGSDTKDVTTELGFFFSLLFLQRAKGLWGCKRAWYIGEGTLLSRRGDGKGSELLGTAPQWLSFLLPGFRGLQRMQVRNLNVHIHGRWLKYWRPSMWTLDKHGRPSMWTPTRSFGQNSKHAETMLNLYTFTCHTYVLSCTHYQHVIHTLFITNYTHAHISITS
ncbi:hypothetical protein Taro_022309 [Colocasia esculenta]|uniref:CCHC-type domain-containing protein n=1 Tax=Colocasia esculenta TaxID=4460 RepID=A0A843V4Z4_COLES|nr:hypothetical protein [Colocasia esculenta]